jgi:peptide deformylase
MAIKKIRINPDRALRQKAKRIGQIDESVQRLIDDMLDTLQAAGGVGLAAPQIGVSQRVVVIIIPGEEPITLINPEIIKSGGQRLVIEGCLSIPGYQGELNRSEWVKVKAKDRTGKEIRMKGEELLAQAFEHEIDHLNGILYIDRLESADKLYQIDTTESPEDDSKIEI